LQSPADLLMHTPLITNLGYFDEEETGDF